MATSFGVVGSPLWLIARSGTGGLEVLTVALGEGSGDGPGALPVFSSGRLADSFLRTRGDRGARAGEWRARESTAGEIVSILSGLLADIDHVLRDPAHGRFGDGRLAVDRADFVNILMDKARGVPGKEYSGAWDAPPATDSRSGTPPLAARILRSRPGVLGEIRLGLERSLMADGAPGGAVPAAAGYSPARAALAGSTIGGLAGLCAGLSIATLYALGVPLAGWVAAGLFSLLLVASSAAVIEWVRVLRERAHATGCGPGLGSARAVCHRAGESRQAR